MKTNQDALATKTNARLCVKVEEMADMLGVSRAAGYELAHSEGFPSIRAGRRILIPVAGLERWLEQQGGYANAHDDTV